MPRLDGVLHSIGFAPATALGGVFLETPWEDVATTMHASAFSLKSLAVAALPLMTAGGSIVGLDFDARQAWPAYDWMGVAKAALESTSPLPGARSGQAGHPGQPGGGRPDPDHGGQVHPRLRRPGERAGRDRAPLGWDTSDPTPVARACVALLSDLFPATSGSMVMVDGGFHALGFGAAEVAAADAPSGLLTAGVGRSTQHRDRGTAQRPAATRRSAVASGRSTSSTAAIW